MNTVVIPTFPALPGCLADDPRWKPMCDWLIANKFDIYQVPCDARIEIRDGTCLGVECYVRTSNGDIIWDEVAGQGARRTEWHPMGQEPPEILLPAGWSS